MSLHSMTAFAREAGSEPVALQVELRSVNHRYLDCHFKLPDSAKALEAKFREVLGRTLKRGKVECQIRIANEEKSGELNINETRLQEVLAAVAQVASASSGLGLANPIDILQFPGVCESGGQDEESLHATLLALFERALTSLVENRAREGQQLGEFMRQRLEKLIQEVLKVREELPAIRERQEERMRRKFADLEQNVEEGRLEQELVLILQRADVDEELDRLDAHVKEIHHVLAKGGPCGRRLDFLMQELNREANTLSSKAMTSSTTQSAVELKVLIEQMREQVQNIE
ncbi:MAG: YicC/YloC family endoribonuclease [Pseudomonadota bacterium]